jgi:hypothetical protein
MNVGTSRKNGTRYVEAYPVTPDLLNYRLRGYRSTFQWIAFRFTGKAGQRRNVMVLKL